MGKDTVWTEDKIAQLKELWNEGLSTKQIGWRLGVSKNAIAGKARRLGLPGRPSPIKWSPDAPRKPKAKRKNPIRLISVTPAAASKEAPEEEQAAECLPEKTAEDFSPTPEAGEEDSAPPQTPARPQAFVSPRRPAECQWPLGEPGKPGFYFCGAPAMPGKPYCEEHANLAYVTVGKAAKAA